MSKEDINIHLANMRRLKMEQVINYYNDLIKDLDRLIKRLEDLGIEENIILPLRRYIASRLNCNIIFPGLFK